MIDTLCAWCFRSIKVYPSKYGVNNYCCASCRKAAMSMRDKENNPKLMTDAVRKKLHDSRLGSGEGKTYEKTYGRHTHRVVAESMLGRHLIPGEVVHHIDGDKRNNSPENLMVFSSQSEHAKWHAAQKKKEVMPDAFQAASVPGACDQLDS